jgi:hypothetical protein
MASTSKRQGHFTDASLGKEALSRAHRGRCLSVVMLSSGKAR